jgi:hypothetical protein
MMAAEDHPDVRLAHGASHLFTLPSATGEGGRAVPASPAAIAARPR